METWNRQGKDGHRYQVSLGSVTIAGQVNVNVTIIRQGAMAGTSSWFEGPTARADALAFIWQEVGEEPAPADFHLPA